MSTSTALHSSLNNLSTALQNLMAKAGSISEAIGRHLSVVEAFTQKVQDSSNAFSELVEKIVIISRRVEELECSFHEKMDNMSKTVDGLRW
ncbi:hypothetical protein BDV33DRAFT_210798 [Aspergillus novoparasiticus]|uniref:Uncharacterized protein n=1 Tax=Aspergillus novoparasiticus TaxID=986946 RepID=A0A5N6E6T5_9EURO|nr:hypothetical protein BDV33DRAFT_210798 [Aspergillus novoparasiticus]